MIIKHLYIITGTSSGIGKSIVEHLANSPDVYVIGISRTESIQSKNYQHYPLDLSDVQSVKSFEMPIFDNVESICLINNAGILGAIRPLNKQNLEHIEDCINVNYTASMILATKFIQSYEAVAIKTKSIINISSGAASSPYASWANYCSSKAAIEMLTKCINKEQENVLFPIRAFAIAPGVVDTAMQAHIRTAQESDFAMLPKFIELYNENQLYPPDRGSREQIVLVSKKPNEYKEAIFRIQIE